MSDERTMNPVLAIVLVILMISGVVYAPLFLSLAESKLLGSQHVYSFFDTLGLADPLKVFYEPVIRLLD